MTAIIIGFLVAPAAAIDVNSSKAFQYYGDGSTLDFEVETDGDTRVQSLLDLNQNQIDSIGSANVNFDSSGNLNLADQNLNNLASVDGGGDQINIDDSVDLEGNDIDNVGELSVNTSSTDIANFTSSGIEFYQPLSLDASGPLSVGSGIEMTDSSSNTIDSYSTLYLETSSGSPSDIVLDPTGQTGVRGNLDVTGNATVEGFLDIQGSEVRDVSNLYSDDSSSNFFASDCPSGKVITGINSDGSYTCADSSAQITDIWVNESGDTMIGDLSLNDNASLTNTEEIRGNTGTSADPLFTFDGDANTGVYSPGAGQVAITTDGSRGLEVTSGQQVQIPAGNLQLKGNNISMSDGSLQDADIVETNRLDDPEDSSIEVTDRLDIGNPSNTGKAVDVGGGLNVDSGIDTYGNIDMNGQNIVDSNDNEVNVNDDFAVSTNADISSPSNTGNALDVGGSVNVDGSLDMTNGNVNGVASLDGGGDAIQVNDAANLNGNDLRGIDYLSDTGDTNRLRLDSSNGEVDILNSNLNLNGNNAMTQGAWLSYDASNNGVYIDSSNQVGIGTNPSEPFEVSGYAQFNDDVQVRGDLDVLGRITNTEVQNVLINGSMLPSAGYDATFSLGNGTRRWKSAYVSGNLYDNQGSNFFENGNTGSAQRVTDIDSDGTIQTATINHGNLNGLSDAGDHPQYLERDGTDQMSGNLRLNGNWVSYDATGSGSGVYIDSSENVGIGKSTLDNKFEVDGSADIGASNTNTGATLDVGGSINVDGGIDSYGNIDTNGNSIVDSNDGEVDINDDANVSKTLDVGNPSSNTGRTMDVGGGLNMNGVIDMNKYQIINVPAPDSGGDAVNKTYVDNKAGSVNSTATQTLAEVLNEGNSADDTDIDMSNQNINNVASIDGGGNPVETDDNIDMNNNNVTDTKKVAMNGVGMVKSGGNLVITDSMG